MARTKAALSKDVLRKLGILSGYEDASAEDAALVEARYDDKLEELRDKGLVYWSHTSRTSEDIPNVIYDAIVNVMCEAVAPYYGVTVPALTDDQGRPVSIGTKGLRDLRAHIAKQASGEPTRAVYF